LGNDLWLPEATEVDGHIIKLFDPAMHRITPVEQTRLNRPDGRWVHCKRPVVISGGELTLDALDLRYSPTSSLLRGAPPDAGQRRHVPDRTTSAANRSRRATCSIAGSCR